MQYKDRNEAHAHVVYYSVCDPFGSVCYPKRFSTIKEARKEKREASIGPDLEIILVDVLARTTKRVN